MADLRRRRLFLTGNLLFTACLVAGVVLVLVLPTLAGKVVVACCLVALLVANILLRLTYFKNVLPEIREERLQRRFEQGQDGA